MYAEGNDGLVHVRPLGIPRARCGLTVDGNRRHATQVTCLACVVRTQADAQWRHIALGLS